MNLKAITIPILKTKVQKRIDIKDTIGANSNLFKTIETPFKTIGAWIKYIPKVFFPIKLRGGILIEKKENSRNKVNKYWY